MKRTPEADASQLAEAMRTFASWPRSGQGLMAP
jgi:hypothetical protein